MNETRKEKESLFQSRWKALETMLSNTPQVRLDDAMRLAVLLVDERDALIALGEAGQDTCLLCGWTGSPHDPHACGKGDSA